MLTLRQVVLDTADVRGLAEFYRELLGFEYRAGDECRPGDEYRSGDGEDEVDWLVLIDPVGGQRIAFQQVPGLPEPTWPDGPRPQMLHLDLSVPDAAELYRQHQRATGLGARLLSDRSDDPQEPLRVYADPAGHPFCVFVADT